MANTTQEEHLNNSLPLRRKSLMPRRILSTALSENDDDAERLTLRTDVNSSLNASDRRRSLGLGNLVQMPANQMKERILECIKLGTENKINSGNAFGLQIIDFMVCMIKKQDANMSNLQVASSSLEVGIKIYGFRVDDVYMKIVNMVNASEKNERARESISANEREEVASEEVNGNESEKLVKKKRRKSMQTFATVSGLKTNVEIAKVTPSIFGETDTQTTEMLCQAMLPSHAQSRFYLHQHNDVILDTADGRNIQQDLQQYDLLNDLPNSDEFVDSHISPILHTFDFRNWTIDDEEEEPVAEPEKQNETEINENHFHFDIDASLPADNEYSGINYLDIDSNEEHVEKCARELIQTENLKDFHEVLSKSAAVKISEYSYVQKNLNIHWAGPSHWKTSNLKRTFGTSRIVETCRQTAAKKRKEVNLNYDDAVVNIVTEKFTPGQGVKLQAKTAKTEWNEEKLTLPQDEHYDITRSTKLYLHPLIVIEKIQSETDKMDQSDDNNYDYNNENDMSNYFPTAADNDGPVTNDVERGTNDNVPEVENVVSQTQTQRGYIGDNLVALPKLANKVTIAYSVKAKKIDMTQLKRSIWKCLTTVEDKENQSLEELQKDGKPKMTESKQFSNVYKELPKLLTKSNAEALSFPISFVSLLHLANEKTLRINSPPDLSDIIIDAN